MSSLFLLAELKIVKARLGPDEIESTSLRMFKEALTNPLTKLFNLILGEGLILEIWELSDIILHKKGDKYSFINPLSLFKYNNVFQVLLQVIKELPEIGIFPSSRTYIEGEARNFLKHQSQGGSSEFFQVPEPI